MNKRITVCLAVLFLFSLGNAESKKDAAMKLRSISPQRDGYTWLEMNAGYDADLDPGAAEASLDACLYLDTFDWEGEEYEMCCNFWEVYLSVNFTELDAPLTSLWEGDYDDDTEERVVYNGLLHEPHNDDYSEDAFSDTVGPSGYDLMGMTAMGNEASGVSVVVTQYQAGYEHWDSWNNRDYQYVKVTVHNGSTTNYTGGSVTIFNDNDAGGGWWPDEECADWEDCTGDEDAFLWHKSGVYDATGLIYQYFDPAVVDMDEDGTADFDDPPYINAGMSWVTGGNSVNLGVYEDPWGTFNVDVFSELLEGYYDYDDTYEADSNATDLGSFITVNIGALAADAETSIVVAFVGGEDSDEIISNSKDASDRWAAGLKVDDNSISLPSAFNLKQNYPNPFNPTTTIAFELDRDGLGQLDIFDINGKLVKTLMQGVMLAGQHTVQWDATGMNGQIVPSGVYFYKLTQNGTSQSQKMVLMR
ncbi:MAG TPA: T9SS type A sorting domain-containing protein [Candidatus Marinimicrobia bacterium]|jgi:hypothetical protein|nr:T9SS type A sorting domain-containing protein [Candidatus Neomarinimicrobiota bacterium]HJL84303.1 T9SS type A sorting domain-containing protein [Candidatus Neomarinimicrobiota bacterium]|tara:strand:+ start:59 stop:1480 length:1422 start_codon:yes stop_codon:yes gene_type:complete